MFLKGKTAVITGSTSGMGLAYVKAFAAEGAAVVLNGFGDSDAIERKRAALAEIGDNAKPMQVVRHVYSDVDKKLWPAARMSVKTQLAYLREN
jgi:NAD(P)-dependent dehydrogenase (short-subunit alcohol dehydrogenase family)